MEITFWADKLFEGESGETIPAGYTIRTPITRQVDEQKAKQFRGYGQLVTIVMTVVIILFFFLTIVVKGDLVPVFGLFETL